MGIHTATFNTLSDDDRLSYIKNKKYIDSYIDLYNFKTNEGSYECYYNATSKPSLSIVPYKYRDYKMCKAYIYESRSNAKYIPYDVFDNKLCEYIVDTNACAYLIYIPQNYKTLNVCEIAVGRNSYNIIYVPHNIMTSKLCLMALKKRTCEYREYTDIWLEGGIKHLYELFDMELCDNLEHYIINSGERPKDLLHMVRCNPWSFMYLTQEEKTHDICEFVYSEGHQVCFSIPIKYIEEFSKNIQASSFDNCYMITFIPDYLKTPKMCRDAIYYDTGNNIKYIPYDMRTRRICGIAVSRNACNFVYVPLDMINIEMCKDVINSGFSDAMYYIPIDLRSDVIRSMGLQKNKKYIKYITEDDVTEEMCIDIIDKDEWSMGDLKYSLQTPKLVEYFNHKYPGNLRCLYSDKRTYKVCMTAIRVCVNNIIFTPEEVQTYDMCKYVMDTNDSSPSWHSYLEYISDKFKDEHGRFIYRDANMTY